MPRRAQPGRLLWPLSPEQLELIDTMFQELYDDTDNGSIESGGGLTSPVGPTDGGTGIVTYSPGDIIYASAADTLAKLAKNTSSSRYLSNKGASNIPAWSQVDLTDGVTGVLPVASGGSGLSSLTQGDLLYASAANTLAALAKNTSSKRYLSNTGTSNNPAWAQIDLASGVTGVLPVANGGTGSSSIGGFVQTGDIGVTVQGYDADLAALAALSSNGLIARTGAGTVAARTISNGAGISISNGDGVSGNPTITCTVTGATILKKTSNQSITNSNTLQDDADFQFAVSANTFYLVHCYMILRATTTGTDWKFNWSLPAGASILQWGPEWLNGSSPNWNGQSTASSPPAVSTGQLTFGSINGDSGLNFIAILSIGANAGTAKLQWAQNSAGGAGVSNTILAGSTMFIH